MKEISYLLLTFCLLGCKSIIETTTTQRDDNSIGFYYLPTGVLKLDIIKITKENKTDYHLNCESQIIPDISQRYYLTYSQSFNSNDNILFELESKNFLKKIKIESEDVTDELIVKISDIVTQTVKMSTVSPGDGEEASIDTIKTLYYITNQKDEQLDEELLKYKMKVNVKKFSFNGEVQQSNYKKKKFDGIIYRPIIPYLVEINNEKGELIKSSLVYLPDNDVVEFDISRASFVKKVTEVDFDNGSISKFSINKPSQSLELASVPVEVLKSIIAIPKELIQLKIDLSSENMQLIQAQQAEIEAKNNLIKLLESLAESDESTSTGTGDPF